MRLRRRRARHRPRRALCRPCSPGGNVRMGIERPRCRGTCAWTSKVSVPLPSRARLASPRPSAPSTPPRPSAPSRSPVVGAEIEPC
eukprot:4675164-Prymnesium_polylepis.1